MRNTDADIVLHATASFLDEVYPQIAMALEAGMSVISICEELAYPWYRNPELADKIDRLAREKDVTVLGTGVRPGFSLDTLVIHCTGLCAEVKRITAKRMSDSSLYGPKVLDRRGLGLSLDQWEKRVSEKRITGHIGSHESMRMIGASLGWDLDETVEMPIEPIIAEAAVELPYLKIARGTVCGYNQKAHGLIGGEKVILFENEGRVYGEGEEHHTEDSVHIEGSPEIKLTIRPGLPGDVTTSSVAVNAIAQVMASRPGLVSMKDLPKAGTFGEGPERRLFKSRRPEDKNPPWCHVEAGIVASKEEIALAQVEGYGSIPEACSTRKKIAAKCRRIGRELDGMMGNPRPPKGFTPTIKQRSPPAVYLVNGR